MFSFSVLFLNELLKTKQNDLCLRVAVEHSNGKTFIRGKEKYSLASYIVLYAYVVETDPFMVQFFEPNISRSDAYRLSDVKFEVLPEDFVQKVKDPQLVVNEVLFTSYCCVSYFNKRKK